MEFQFFDEMDSNPNEFLNENSDDIEIHDPIEGKKPFPDNLPILPLRGLVVFPLTGVPLTIGQPRSIRLIDEAVSSDRLIGLVASTNPELDNPGANDLYRIGCIAVINRLFRAPDGTIRLLVQGLQRIKITEFTTIEPFLRANIVLDPEIKETGLEVEALSRNARDQFNHIAELISSIPRELVSSVLAIENPLQIAYTIANFQRMDIEDAQQILEFDSVIQKYRKLNAILARESQVLELGRKIQDDAKTEIDKSQREYYLREQLKAIQRELGENNEQSIESEDFRKKIDVASLPEEALKIANRELEKLSRLPTSAAEYGVIRTYLDWLVSLPWSITSSDNLEIQKVKKILNEDHFGLTDVKMRILEFLAVRKLKAQRQEIFSKIPDHKDNRHERQGVILCFIGPPGVGKTSLGQSIARGIGRKFIRLSLGGMRDEAEIRGHRRTYIGAMPGRILQSIRRVGSRNPVFMLDEIDKLTTDFHGDPAAALLEVLDPEQNFEFRDNYLEVAFDLSQVMFITTANTLETIPSPLLDRMEVIQLSGYTEGEKLKIARKFLIPRQLRENGLLDHEITFEDSAINSIIRHYTRESGVRNLERLIGSVCRKVVVNLNEKNTKSFNVTSESLRDYLGNPKFIESEEVLRRTSTPGVATGLAWTPLGGEIIFIEASKMPGNQKFQITGSIGNVMQESASAALTYIRSHTTELGIKPDFFKESDIHLHIPAGATPKDGPSAGITLATAMVSLLTNKRVNPAVGMTGEITLSGQVLPIGGLKEKVLAAYRSGLKIIIFPSQNQHDLDELPNEIKKRMKFIPIENISQVLDFALQDQFKKWVG